MITVFENQVLKEREKEKAIFSKTQILKQINFGTITLKKE